MLKSAQQEGTGLDDGRATDAARLRHALADELTLLLAKAERRAGRGVDRGELARRVLVSTSSLYAYLKGATLPSADVFDRLMAKLEVTGAELGRLSTLRDEAALAKRRPKASPAPPSPVPHQLPAPVVAFVGREAELERLDQIVGDSDGTVSVVVVLDGVAGIGKTTLALRWAHLLADHFPDGHLHVNLRGFDVRTPVTAGQALFGFLQALGVAPAAIPDDPDARAALFRTLVAGKRVLVFADNARSAEHVRPLLPGTAEALVLVTSRVRLDGLVVRDGAHLVTLDLLPEAGGIELLGKRLGPGSVASARAEAAQLVELCGGLPLALAIAAARVAAQPGLPLGALVAELRSRQVRLDALGLGEPDLDLRSVFSWSVEALPAPAERLFRALGAHPGPDIDPHGCAALLGTSTPPRVELRALCAANLVTERVPGRYGMHDLVRVYAGELFAEADHDTRQPVLRRMLDHYTALAETADDLINPYDVAPLEPLASSPVSATIDGYAEAMAWFSDEFAVLRSLVKLAAEQATWPHAWRLAWAMMVFLRRTSRRAERVAIQRVALDAALRAGDQRAYATTLRLLADALSRTGEPATAVDLLHTALAEFVAIGDRDGIRQTHLSLARVHGATGESDTAARHARTALHLAVKLGDLLAEADGLSAVSRQLCAFRPDESRTLALRALDLYTQLGHKEGAAGLLMILGEAEQHLGRYSAAISRYRRAAELDRDLGDRYWEACALDRLADVHHLVDDREQSEALRAAAIAILDELRHPDAAILRAKSRTTIE